MTRNAYAQIRRLATHPMFSMRTGWLACPYGDCEFESSKPREAEAHLLSHEPTAETGYSYLSARTWEREAPKRGWTVPRRTGT
jgi:hypothetical protein